MLGVSITAEGEFAQTGLADEAFSPCRRPGVRGPARAARRGAARRGATGPAALRRGRPALPPFRPDPPLPFRTHLLTLDRPDGPAWRSALCGLNAKWGGHASGGAPPSSGGAAGRAGRV